MSLSKLEIEDSYEAVRQFLIDGEKLINGGNIRCWFKQGSQRSEKEINFQVADHVSSYIISDDIFKSYKLRTPIWSSYKLLKWDDATKELVIEVKEQYTEIRLKRIH